MHRVSHLAGVGHLPSFVHDSDSIFLFRLKRCAVCADLVFRASRFAGFGFRAFCIASRTVRFWGLMRIRSWLDLCRGALHA